MVEAQTQQATAHALLGLPSEWTVLNDVAWPGRDRADIDHVVVGPGGIFVIVSGRAGRQAASAASSAAGVLAKGARLRRRIVHPVVCSATPEPESSGGVLRCTPDIIVEMLLGRAPVIDRDELVSASATVSSQVRRERGVRARLTGGTARRERRSGSTGRLAIFLLLVAAVVVAAPRAADRLESARAADPPPTPRLGQTVRLVGAADRPPLDLTAEHVRDTESGGSAYVVRVTVRNDGRAPFALDSLEVGLMLDNLHHAGVIGHPRAGLAGAELQPGMERIVTYRFDVPAARAAQLVAVAVGGRRGDRAEWLAAQNDEVTA